MVSFKVCVNRVLDTQVGRHSLRLNDFYKLLSCSPCVSFSQTWSFCGSLLGMKAQSCCGHMTGGTRQGTVLDCGGVAPRWQYTGLLPGGLSLGLEGGVELGAGVSL